MRRPVALIEFGRGRKVNMFCVGACADLNAMNFMPFLRRGFRAIKVSRALLEFREVLDRPQARFDHESAVITRAGCGIQTKTSFLWTYIGVRWNVPCMAMT